MAQQGWNDGGLQWTTGGGALAEHAGESVEDAGREYIERLAKAYNERVDFFGDNNGAWKVDETERGIGKPYGAAYLWSIASGLNYMLRGFYNGYSWGPNGKGFVNTRDYVIDWSNYEGLDFTAGNLPVFWNQTTLRAYLETEYQLGDMYDLICDSNRRLNGVYLSWRLMKCLYIMTNLCEVTNCKYWGGYGFDLRYGTPSANLGINLFRPETAYTRTSFSTAVSLFNGDKKASNYGSIYDVVGILHYADSPLSKRHRIRRWATWGQFQTDGGAIRYLSPGDADGPYGAPITGRFFSFNCRWVALAKMSKPNRIAELYSTYQRQDFYQDTDFGLGEGKIIKFVDEVSSCYVYRAGRQTKMFGMDSAIYDSGTGKYDVTGLIANDCTLIDQSFIDPPVPPEYYQSSTNGWEIIFSDENGATNDRAAIYADGRDNGGFKYMDNEV